MTYDGTLEQTPRVGIGGAVSLVCVILIDACYRCVVAVAFDVSVSFEVWCPEIEHLSRRSERGLEVALYI